jgi:predicted PurR-regulated permease PerM
MPDESGDDARRRLRGWLPHLAVVGLVLAAAFWLVLMTAPVHQALLLAASLSALTYPVLFAPIDRHLARWTRLWQDAQRRYLSALIATAVLVAGVAGLLLATLWSILGGLGTTVHALIGLALHDQEQIHALVEVVVRRLGTLLHLYPALHVDDAQLRQTLLSTLEQTSVGPAFLSYLVTGTGSVIAQGVLTTLTVFYFFIEGPQLARLLMAWLPLGDDQRELVGRRFNAAATHLLLGTIARAAAHGVALGTLAALIAGIGTNVVLVALLTTFLALLPVVGPSVAWLPLASILYTTGHPVQAACLGVASLCSVWIIEHLSSRLSTALGTDEHWLSFLLFISVVGGVIGFGPRGVVLGAGAVLAISLAASLLPLLYGRPGPGGAGPGGPEDGPGPGGSRGGGGT